ncbi:hypothetical protein [Frigoribacterium faeni]|uniref:2-phosphosulfolactate phosphatase n=1 Tax=Frigoribacterium faeni TaxID=145483 RepID=A0A7W3PKA2_9MICO|nr:hypothetical protein [Frigoribacterium faeni]MBA8814589.1 hypothetical protein [Frigoribacterium faeni]GEK83483.1 hypothetical protein FFA01_17920 [Frigoribacterium faeni]
MNAHGQQKHQVRLDHGIAGASRIAPGAHLVVVVDALDGHGLLSTAETLRAVASAPGVDPDADLLLVTGPAAAADAARRVIERQARRGDRAVVAIVAAGSVEPDGFRPAVEDQLAAGAVVDALAALGIDASSPEAAVACAAAVSLARASTHLLTASASAAELVATDRGDLVESARASSGQADRAVAVEVARAS